MVMAALASLVKRAPPSEILVEIDRVLRMGGAGASSRPSCS